MFGNNKTQKEIQIQEEQHSGQVQFQDGQRTFSSNEISKMHRAQSQTKNFNRFVISTTLLFILFLFFLVQSCLNKTKQQDYQITVIILDYEIQSRKEALKSIQSYFKGKNTFKKRYKFKLPFNLDQINRSIYNGHLVQQQDLPYPFQIGTLSYLISNVDTKYYFLTTTKWEVENLEFLPQLITLYESSKDMNISAVYLTNSEYKLSNISFSFSPGLYKKQNYIPLNSITKDYFYFTKQSEKQISNNLKNLGLNAIFKEDKRFRMINYEIKKLEEPNNSQAIIKKLSSLMSDALPVTNIAKYNLQIKELPFCIIVLSSNEYTKKQIFGSLQKLQYSNFEVFQSNTERNYYSLKEDISKNCRKNSYVMIVTYPLTPISLTQLNKLHQSSTAWISYNKTQSSIEIYSFLFRVYDLLDLNDFDKSNQKYLFNGDRQIQTIGMIQICFDQTIPVIRQFITLSRQKPYFTITSYKYRVFQRTSYFPVISLSQQYKMGREMISILKSIKNQMTYPVKYISPLEIVKKSIDRRQQIFIPQNHSIFEIQRMQFSQKYGILEKILKNKQVRFCVTILSYNNNQYGRYSKIIESIKNQDYDNYHIVFIDDFSTDGNMEKTIQYIKKIKFPLQKITFIQNKMRNYATYNIINAAYNYCQDEQVQLLLDGDDEIIGKYAFQALNSQYVQDSQVWAVYSNYKSNYLTVGVSQQFKSQSDYLFQNGSRKIISNIGAIRTWKVKLIHAIPGQCHKYKGEWLKTLYDDGLQHPIVQMSTAKRLKYLPEVLYEYNINYGNNDNSSKQKILFRDAVHLEISQRKPYHPIQRLSDRNRDDSIWKQLRKDNLIKYEVVKPKKQ